MSSHASRLTGYISAVITHVMFVIAAAAGLISLNAGIRMLASGTEPLASGLICAGVGAVFTGVGAGFFYLSYVKVPLWSAREKKLEARYPGEPWMLNAAWARRRMVHSSGGAAIFLWVWVAGWWSAILFIWNVNRDKILAAMSESFVDAGLTLLLPLAGLIGLAIAVQLTRSWWLYGRSELHIDTLPGWIGDVFRGYVEARFPARPVKPIEVRLVCERVTWVTTGHGKERTRERRTKLIWETKQEIAPSWVRAAKGDKILIPLEIAIPDGLPQCTSGKSGGGIEWTLYVEAAIEAAPYFSCHFAVPVYSRR